MADDLSIIDDLWDVLLDTTSSTERDEDEDVTAPPTASTLESDSSSSERNSLTTSLTTATTASRLPQQLSVLDAGPPTEELVNEFRDADLDTMLAKELSRLSIKERDRCLEEIHGFEKPIEETPEYVKSKLDEVQECLSRITRKDAYEQALYNSPEYVADPKFLMHFLRGEQFHPPRAASRLVKHFELKLELFGKELLGRDILYSDLTDDDIEALEEGYEQILPMRDSADRLVACILPLQDSSSYTKLSRFRASFYFAMSVFQDENALQNGFVAIVFNVAPNHMSFEATSFLWRMSRLREAVPHRASCVHYVYDQRRLSPLVAFTYFLVESFVMGRFIPHLGTYAEYTYALQTYSIPTQFLPLDENGSILRENHLEWLRNRQAEEASGVRTTALVPRRFDVLLGKGQIVSNHSGNLRAFHIVEMNRAKYEEADKHGKTQIAEDIVDLIHQSYGRFLKKEQGRWGEVTKIEAREKISHCFRRLRELDRKGRQSMSTKRPSNVQKETTIGNDESTASSNGNGTKRCKSHSL